MLKRIAERNTRHAAATGEEAALAEEALRILYQRKAFREETGTEKSTTPGQAAAPAASPARHARAQGPPRPPARPGRAEFGQLAGRDTMTNCSGPG